MAGTHCMIHFEEVFSIALKLFFLEFKTLSLSQIFGSVLCPPGPLGEDPTFQTHWGSISVPVVFLGKDWAPRAPGHVAPLVALCLGPIPEVFLCDIPMSAGALCLAPSCGSPQARILCWWLSGSGDHCPIGGSLGYLFHKSIAHS